MKRIIVWVGFVLAAGLGYLLISGKVDRDMQQQQQRMDGAVKSMQRTRGVDVHQRDRGL